MDSSAPDPNNNNNDANNPPIPSTPLNTKTLAEELGELDPRVVLANILGAVGEISRAIAAQGTRLDRLEEGSSATSQLPPAPSVVRGATVTGPPAAVTKRTDASLLAFDDVDAAPVSTPMRWADRMEAATPQVSEVPRGAKQTEVVSVDLKVDLDQTQPDKRLTLVNVVVRVGGVGRVGQVQPGVGDKLGEVLWRAMVANRAS
jgi:hypothetical protein